VIPPAGRAAATAAALARTIGDLFRTIGHARGGNVKWVLKHRAPAAHVRRPRKRGTRHEANESRPRHDAATLGALVTFTHARQPRTGSSDEIVASAFSTQVTGTVKSVDPGSGKLVLDTPDGAVNVTFPGPAIQGIKVGDPVTIAFGIVKPSPSTSPDTGSSQTSPGSKY
jgi:hypothetical protein